MSIKSYFTTGYFNRNKYLAWSKVKYKLHHQIVYIFFNIFISRTLRRICLFVYEIKIFIVPWIINISLDIHKIYLGFDDKNLIFTKEY